MAALVKAGVPLAIYGSGWAANGSKRGNGAQAETEETEYLGRKIRRPASLESYRQMLMSNLQRRGITKGTVRALKQKRYQRKTQQLSPLFADFSYGSIPFEQMLQVFSGNEVILNFSNVWADGRAGSDLIPHVRLRDFEAPMCRTCYLTGHSDEIAEFYEPGKEIDTYRDPEELIAKTKHYLSHPDEAERLREAGYRRALRDHTWERRFEDLFSAIGLAK
jgi:hypothetical protein